MGIGAYTLIFDEDRRVLLCHRRDFDAWNLPGGGVDPDETPWEAAVRETREEVGVDVEIVRLTGIYWKPRTRDLVFSFEGRIVAGIPTTSDEADRVGYFSIADLPANTSPIQMERIRDALSDGPTVMRTQSGPGIRDLFPATPAT